MRAFHTLWTRPFLAKNAGADFSIPPAELLTTILSALLWRANNGPIIMVTDTLGLNYLHSLGLSCFWDNTDAILDYVPSYVSPNVYWACGKLFALRKMHAPCVMLDTDFLVWESLEHLLCNCECAVIHTEELDPTVYPEPSLLFPDASAFLSSWDTTITPVNTAFAYFASDTFKDHYTETAFQCIQLPRTSNDPLTYMVFAEQRLLAMLAHQDHVSLSLLSDLPTLFSASQQRFTHLWGAKQQLRDNPVLNEVFCRRCAQRLSKDFPSAVTILQEIPSLKLYFT